MNSKGEENTEHKITQTPEKEAPRSNSPPISSALQESNERSSIASSAKSRALQDIELDELRRPSERRKSIKSSISKKLSIKLSAKKSDGIKIQIPIEKYRAKANYIKTTKYTLLNFLPKNLYMQFGRFYNLYFLLGALAIFAGFSSLSVSSQIAPLLVVLAFSAAKEAVEDFNRFKADTHANNTPCTILKNKDKVVCSSQDIQPGQIVFVEKGQKFHTDIILLCSSYEDGTVFVETAELDGETNLKRKTSIALTQDYDIIGLSDFKGCIECESANENLLTFNGRLKEEKSSAAVALSMLNMAPRGAVLRNTDYVYGVVVYSGSDTKIMKNLKTSKLKSSKLEAQLNTFVLYAFVYNAILLVTSVILEYIRYVNIQKMEDPQSDELAVEWYLGFQMTNRGLHLWSTVVSFFTLYSYVIPISLFVSIELVRLGQATFMSWDPKMGYIRKNTDGTSQMILMRANNSNLNEELGNVNYIFSDKTGTLTQNLMKLDKWFIEGYTLEEMQTPGIIYQHLQNNDISLQVREKMNLFLTGLALCHGVIPSFDTKMNKMIYESQSPDETALLEAAEQNAFKLLTRTKKNMEVEIMGSIEKFEILSTIEFNSTRKRMSIIVKNGDGIRLYSKGADNIMMERLDPLSNDANMVTKTMDTLIEFSNIGLRTLVVGYRNLTQEEYEHFKVVYDAAECSLVDREEKIDEAANTIETGLTLLGCSAIEDKLQDKVPETIDNLLQAGIKFWLLTGDKQETAINIGISSKLINRRMNLLILNGSDPQTCEKELDQIISEMEQSLGKSTYAMVVDGKILSHVFAGDKKSKEKFLKVGKQCKTVICSRVTPLQKALVVRLVRSSLKKSITLSIGDGANDVSMIQEAHVGVGIMGREGNQAVRAADFAFGEFRFLQRLLTVHGRYNSVRLSNMILYCFYKNFVFITIQWFFGFVNGWSGQLVYEEIFFVAYNVIFTSIPPMIYGLFEKDLPEVLLEKYPQLYREVKDGLFWNLEVILGWFLSAISHSCIIFLIVYYVNFEGAVDVDGRSTGYWVQCYFLSTPLLLVVLGKIVITSRYWTWLPVAGILSSLGINAAVMFALVLLDWYSYADFGTAELLHSIPAFYLFCTLLPCVCLLIDLLIAHFWKLLRPKDTDLMLEYTAKAGLKI